MSRASSLYAERKQSPTMMITQIMKTDQLLRIMVTKMSRIKTYMHILAKENYTRMLEIQKTGRSSGFKGDIVTVHSNKNGNPSPSHGTNDREREFEIAKGHNGIDLPAKDIIRTIKKITGHDDIEI